MQKFHWFRSAAVYFRYAAARNSSCITGIYRIYYGPGGDIVAFIISHQFSIMLFMSGICGILAFLTLITDSLSPRKRAYWH